MATIRAVMFDADGVLQHAPRDWVEALDAVGGEGFVDVVFEHELPAMCGERSMRDCLRESATSFGVDIDLDDVLELWRRFRIDEEALAVVEAVRRAGLRACLATNQQDVRRDVMRERYAGVFDGSFYSCELGAAKPDTAFFDRAVARLGVDAETVVFVDDSLRNVSSAAQAGLVAVHHEPSGGAEALVAELREAGVVV